jgi:hypothetical protein
LTSISDHEFSNLVVEAKSPGRGFKQLLIVNC